jgi:integrase
VLQKRKTLWQGIRRHGAGWEAEVRVTGHPPARQQFALTTEISEIQRWRRDTKTLLRAQKPKATSGTFAWDAKRYLDAKKESAGIKTRTRHVNLWVAEFGQLPRSAIKPYMILAIRDRWLTIGPQRVWRRWKADNIEKSGGRWVEIEKPLSPSAVNKRLRVLRNLFTVLDGKHAPNPVAEVQEAHEPDAEARGLPYDVIEAMLATMPDRSRPTKGEKRGTVNLTKLRLRAIAYTGFAHAELMRIKLAELHLDDPLPWVWMGGRKKGRGTKGVAQPLTEEGAAALRALADADGLGPFSTSSMRRSFLRAAKKLGISARPYDLRHSYADEILEKTDGNLPVTQMLMRHKDQRTTLRYVQRAIDPVRAAAIAKVRAAGGFK